MNLDMEGTLHFPVATRRFASSLNLSLSSDDAMYNGNDRHYLSCGASALNAILAALNITGGESPTRVLDFGAGAGRVTRWFRAAFPDAALDACDIRAADMEFCASAFDAETWVSGTDIDSLKAPNFYDLIWLGSVATHLAADKTIDLLDKMLSWTTSHGLVVMSLHGRFALQRQRSGEFTYIHDAAWEEIERGYSASGYGYADYEGQSGYGISVSKLSWITEVIKARPNARLVLLAETAWDSHHDVVAIQSTC